VAAGLSLLAAALTATLHWSEPGKPCTPARAGDASVNGDDSSLTVAVAPNGQGDVLHSQGEQRLPPEPNAALHIAPLTADDGNGGQEGQGRREGGEAGQ
jgi:hypothetical protein